ncbi:hypothetical protein HD806DRAFT_523674 [Xylariaceae sp. AK1471]|nr:hypothetical protein HD806DRAFT_523674 [Xylariaceae sp. AK1471]
MSQFRVIKLTPVEPVEEMRILYHYLHQISEPLDEDLSDEQKPKLNEADQAMVSKALEDAHKTETVCANCALELLGNVIDYFKKYENEKVLYPKAEEHQHGPVYILLSDRLTSELQQVEEAWMARQEFLEKLRESLIVTNGGGCRVLAALCDANAWNDVWDSIRSAADKIDLQYRVEENLFSTILENEEQLKNLLSQTNMSQYCEDFDTLFTCPSGRGYRLNSVVIING